MIHAMAQSAKVSTYLIETLDEKGLSVLENWIASLVDTRHLWPDQYLQHLMKVIGTIGRHGQAVVVGRGANFILPPEIRFRVRIVAPRDFRAQHVAQAFGVAPAEAGRRIIHTASERRAFIRKYFNADIDDPRNYDLVLNSAAVPPDEAVFVIGRAAGLGAASPAAGRSAA
jgi:cytidylate kinase